MGKIRHTAPSFLYPMQVCNQPSCLGMGGEVFVLAAADFFFFLSRIKIGRTGRHPCFYQRKVCWVLTVRAMLQTNVS